MVNYKKCNLNDYIFKITNWWEQTVRLVDNNYDTVLDLSACQPGAKTRWISNYMPELHDEGLKIHGSHRSAA